MFPTVKVRSKKARKRIKIKDKTVQSRDHFASTSLEARRERRAIVDARMRQDGSVAAPPDATSVEAASRRWRLEERMIRVAHSTLADCVNTAAAAAAAAAVAREKRRTESPFASMRSREVAEDGVRCSQAVQSLGRRSGGRLSC